MKKRTLAILLIVVMMLGASTALADTHDIGSITVNNVTADTELELYRVVDYTYVDPGTPPPPQGGIYDVDIVDDYRDAFWNAIDDAISGALAANASDEAILQYISDNLAALGGATFAANLAEALDAVADGETANFTNTLAPSAANPWNYANNQLVFGINPNLIPLGYYLIKDVTDGGEGYEALLMLAPMEPHGVAYLKSEDTPPVEKSLVDEDGNPLPKVDYNIGDSIYYKIEATVPYYEGHDWFDYVLTDTHSAGLTFVGPPTATLNGQPYDLTDRYVYDPATRTLTITLDETMGIAARDELVITYESRLNEAAIVDANGNGVIDPEENDSYNTVLDFYNGPGTDYDGDGDTVTVYTYGIHVFKVDENDTPLPGVTFAIKDADGLFLLFDANDKYTGTSLAVPDVNGDGVISEAEFAAAGASAALLVTGANGQILAQGLELGTYQLVEIATLPGYNPIVGDIEVIVDGLDGTTVIALEPETVINVSGIELPGTGGIGTAWFTVLGAVIMGGAVLALVLSRRRSRAK